MGCHKQCGCTEYVNFMSYRSCVSLILYPGIHWNFADAFLGTITSGLLPAPMAGEADSQSLVSKTFLAVPLLKTSGLYNEWKFSGSDMAGDNVDTVGCAIDAYAHHILADSNGSLLMTDLQGMT